MPKGGNLAVLIGVGKGKPKGEPADDDKETATWEEDDEVDAGFEAATEDLMAAIESGDTQAAAKALKDAIYRCM